MSEINREFQLTLQSALREAQSRRHAYLTVEHLLFALIHDEKGAEVLKACGVRVRKLKLALEEFFDDGLETVLGDEPVDTQQTLAFHRVIQSAIQHVRSAEREEVEAGDVLAAIFQEPDCQAVELLRAHGVSRLDVLRYISHGVRKPGSGGEDSGEGQLSSPGSPFSGEEEEEIEDPLAAFSTNLTERAAAGELDPLVGRANEIERVIHILARRRKNNPILVGESGVGKTAIAEGLAQKIVAETVRDDLKRVEIYSLDIGSMLAGTKYRGDFEARFKAFVKAVQERDNPVVFIDEIHTILGAGAAQGATVDASNMLKPLLQSGELRCMGSTTYNEYRHFEKDRALARRFQKVEIPEPSINDAVRILDGLAPRYEEHHGVRFTKPALRAAVELSARHLQDRSLPDKAIDVMDEVGAAVRLRPGKDKRKTVALRDVETLVSKMAQVPIAAASQADRNQLEDLENALRAQVYGQDAAIETLVRSVKRSRAGLGGPEKPIGSFLFTGPTGVGKTELAKQLAKVMNVAFLRFDMSEYVEKHAVARLIGAPPGYVGYDEGGILVDQIRKNPHAVLLLDEIEKANADLFDILLQVMDHATLTDNHGREANFRHVTLIMTSNAGAREMTAHAIGFGDASAGDGRKDLERLFSPEFRNRLDEVIQFAQLTPQVMGRVVDKFVRELEDQLREKKIRFTLTDAARGWLAEKGFDPLFGARPLSRVIQTEIKDKIADEILFGALQKGGVVSVDLADESLSFGFS